MRALILFLCATLLFANAIAQTDNAPPAPSDRAVDIPLEDLLLAASQLRDNGLATNRVLEGGMFSINVRHIQGVETVLQHGRITEVWVVREGIGTVVTGGEMINPEAGAGPGDFRASGITGGEERIIKAGDLVFIPPGVPHHIKETESIVYLNIRFELRDPD